MKSVKSLIATSMIALALTGTASAQNLIVNGDFEAGISGFSTDYRVNASGCIGCVGVDDRTLDWYFVPSLVYDYRDHTSGTGLMLQWDPPEPPSGKRIWYQSVSVVAGTTYSFSGWVREANSESSPNNGLVGVYANGVLLGQKSAPDGSWAQWSFDYTATTTGSIELALRDLYPTTFNGTYSTIDDLSFSAVAAPVPEPEIYAMMGFGLGLLGWVGRRRSVPSR